MLRIIGCPRSGTNWAASYLIRNGYDIGWERWGVQGIVSWMAAVRSDKVPFGTGVYDNQHIRATLMIMRNPIKTIGSIRAVAFGRQNVGKFCEYIRKAGIDFGDEGMDPLGCATWFYLHWTNLCHMQSEAWFRVEDMGLPLLRHCKQVTRPHKTVDFEGMEPTHKVCDRYPTRFDISNAAGRAALPLIQQQADRFGYGAELNW